MRFDEDLSQDGSEMSRKTNPTSREHGVIGSGCEASRSLSEDRVRRDRLMRPVLPVVRCPAASRAVRPGAPPFEGNAECHGTKPRAVSTQLVDDFRVECRDQPCGHIEWLVVSDRWSVRIRWGRGMKLHLPDCACGIFRSARFRWFSGLSRLASMAEEGVDGEAEASDYGALPTTSKGS